MCNTYLPCLVIAENFRLANASNIQNRFSGRCLRAMGTTANSIVELHNCSDSNDQMWYRPSAGSWELSPLNAPGMCLDVVNADPSDDARLQIFTCNGGDAQLWAFDSAGSLRPAVLAISKCVTFGMDDPSSGIQAIIYDCNGGPGSISATSTIQSRYLWYSSSCKSIVGVEPLKHFSVSAAMEHVNAAML